MASRQLPILAARVARPSVRIAASHVGILKSGLSTAAPIAKRPIIQQGSFLQQRVQQRQKRCESAASGKVHVYDFNNIKTLSEKPSKERILVDVREPHEYSEGYIPTSINVPIVSAPEGLLLPADEFEEKFGVEKPTADQEVVFYCKAGVRSSAAAKLAEQAGYQKIGNYSGSWMDWAANGGKVAR